MTDADRALIDRGVVALESIAATLEVLASGAVAAPDVVCQHPEDRRDTTGSVMGRMVWTCKDCGFRHEEVVR
jgi:hypothetical protein